VAAAAALRGAPRLDPAGEGVREVGCLLAHLLGCPARLGGLDDPAEQHGRGQEDGPDPPPVGEIAEDDDPDDDEQDDAPALAVADAALRDDVVVAVGQQGPGDEVERQAEAAEDDEQQESAAHEDRVDAEAVREAGADAGHPLVAGVALEAESPDPAEEAVESVALLLFLGVPGHGSIVVLRPRLRP